MKKFLFMQVDAFTDRPLAGNPCAILFDTDDLDAATMLAIAKEMNLSETAFVRQSTIADFGVRYFTPEEEIPMAGHPTIATAFALVDTGRLAAVDGVTAVTFELPVGPIQVAIHSHNNQVQNIVMTQKKPQFMRKHDPFMIAPLFNLAPDDLLPGLPIQTVSTGTPQLMVPVRDHKALAQIQIDLTAYNEYRTNSDFFSPHLFCLQGITPAGDTFARHPGIFEDPFTGSATGGMAAYLWHYGLINKPNFVAEQGHWLDRPGQAQVEIIGPRENISAVKVGGTAVTILHGTLILPE